MRDFFARQRENLLANVIASVIFAALAAVVAWLANVPPIPVPAWVFIAIIGGIAALLWFSRPIKKLVVAANQSFGVERVYVDGKHFISCKFDGSELVFSGKHGFSLERCAFVSPRVKFEGAAALVMVQLAAMYKEDGFRKMVDASLNEVTHGNVLS